MNLSIWSTKSDFLKKWIKKILCDIIDLIDQIGFLSIWIISNRYYRFNRDIWPKSSLGNGCACADLYHSCKFYPESVFRSENVSKLSIFGPKYVFFVNYVPDVCQCGHFGIFGFSVRPFPKKRQKKEPFLHILKKRPFIFPSSVEISAS